ncbi:transketolase [Rhizobium sp. R634]|uniref:transketolase n=1 Tax=Rhizobium sp. R634 TaxID=1764274 RepID=UPI000B5354F8|nr:transketolase [Rhizobium sp. R634]OWV73145.1 transketolase [Rhizobium sp. R634]OWV73364.1 transketolase [Rhizobium sp. R634]
MREEELTAAVSIRDLANAIRVLSIDAVEAAKSGHPGMPMGMADAAAVLFGRHLKFDSSEPGWPDRDRFVLSNGHGSMLLYSLLHLTGYEDMTIEQVRNFRQWGSKTPGHPEYGHTAGVETTTGPLGQGIASAVGMAIAERRLSTEFGAALVDHRTYVFCGDGCLMEGVGQEAASLAGHLQLGKLIVLYDDNSITIDGSTAIAFSEDVLARFDAYGWHTQRVDGHDPDTIDAAISQAKAEASRPSLIALKTIIGYGSPSRAGTSSVHGAPLGASEAAATKAVYGWTADTFEIPAPILKTWREVGAKGAKARKDWQARLEAAGADVRSEFERRTAGSLPARYEEAVNAAKAKLLDKPQSVATRKASQIALEALTELLPEMIGGSADLTHSNLTRVPAVDSDFTAAASGRYVSYGVREFAMAAAMNGMAAHGGVIPYGGTFLVFSDYCRNAIRVAALMGVRSIFVMTHDSIGLGEDGPTHQPVEHLASLRAMPNLHVFRPADTIETLECWDLAITSKNTPSVLALSRQNVPQLRAQRDGINRCARGAYVLREASSERAVTIIATGTEVALAIQAADELEARNVPAAVVSMPGWDLFEQQPKDYRSSVLGNAPRIAVEALSKFGWTRYVDSEDDVIGMSGFGASAPAETLYEQFGITRDAIVTRALARIRGKQ